MGKDSFVIHTSFYKPISKLSDKQLGRLFRAIFKFQLGEVVSVEEDIDMAFEFFKNQFEIDERKYQSTIERNTENGRKGGNPNFKKGQRNPYYKGDNENSINGGEEEHPNELPKITEDNPTLPKITLYDNDNDIDKESLSNERQKKDGLSFPTPKTEKTDFAGIMEEFNSTFTGKLQGVRSITETRKAAIRARIAQYGKDSIQTVFSIILQSPFLLGSNDRNWRADFDWIFKQANYTKILEGNYNGNGTKNRGNPTSKQEANEYALERLRQHKRELENGMADAVEDPF